MAKLNYEKLSNQLNQNTKLVSPESLKELLNLDYITKNEDFIKSVAKKIKCEFNLKQNFILESISRSQFNLNWHILKTHLKPYSFHIDKNFFVYNGLKFRTKDIINYYNINMSKWQLNMFAQKEGFLAFNLIFKYNNKIVETNLAVEEEVFNQIDSFLKTIHFFIDIDYFNEFKKSYDKLNFLKKEKMATLQKGRLANNILLYESSNNNMYELNELFLFHKKRIKKDELLLVYKEFKKYKEKEKIREKKERLEFQKKHLDFNIWDDYLDGDLVEGYFEDDFHKLTEKDKIDFSSKIAEEIKLIYPEIKCKITDNGISFLNLTHKRREELLERLSRVEIKLKNLTLNIYSES